MNNLSRQKLSELIEKYGDYLWSDPKRCEAMLRDVCGEHRREISALISALKEQVVVDLLTYQNNVPSELLLGRLVKRVKDSQALADDAAIWAVESWALALKVISGGTTVFFDQAYSSLTTPYTLTLRIVSPKAKTWQYSIDLEEFYEDNPECFFRDFDGYQHQKFAAALQDGLQIQVKNSEIDRILHQWIRQISLGYRDTPLEI
ncbi:hypothetical protein [Nostoc sp. CCY 9925]|uniref:hypothetical protein n=1 Tax=Nostoc sp. CCY 9925 TaxID=3103865 RepID=UPI0039C6D049